MGGERFRIYCLALIVAGLVLVGAAGPQGVEAGALALPPRPTLTPTAAATPLPSATPLPTEVPEPRETPAATPAATAGPGQEPPAAAPPLLPPTGLSPTGSSPAGSSPASSSLPAWPWFLLGAGLLLLGSMGLALARGERL